MKRTLQLLEILICLASATPGWAQSPLESPSSSPAPAHVYGQDAKIFAPVLSPDGERIIAHGFWKSGPRVIILQTNPLKPLKAVRIHSNEKLLRLVWDGSEGFIVKALTGPIMWFDRNGDNYRQLTAANVVEPIMNRTPTLIRPTAVNRDEFMVIAHGELSPTPNAPFRFSQAVVDSRGRLVAAISLDETRPELMLRGPDGWVKAGPLAPSAYLLRYAEKARTVYLVDRDDEDRAVVIAVSPGGERSPAVKAQRFEPLAPMFDQHDNLVGVELAAPGGMLAAVDPTSPVIKNVRLLNRNDTNRRFVVSSVSADGERMLVYAYATWLPKEYYLVDRAKKQLRPLFSSVDKSVVAVKEAASRPLKIKASDGGYIYGWLTATATVPAPLVVMADNRKVGVFRHDVQFLVSQGYAVLQVHYRGDRGYGQSQSASDPVLWNRRLQMDVVEAARWAVAEGIGRPGRMAVLGRGLGAYLAAMAAIEAPDLLSCVVGISGFYDLERALDAGDAPRDRVARRLLEEYLRVDGATTRTDSPTQRTPGLRRPMLIAHGRMDREVLFEQAQFMKTRLQRDGVSVDWLAVPTKDFSRATERTALFARIQAFLKAHLRPGPAVLDKNERP